MPVLGDGQYGPKGHRKTAPRVALHAGILGFRHPITGKRLTFVSPLAADLEAFWAESEKPAAELATDSP